MAKTLYLDYAGLQIYDELLKQHINGLNAKSFKSVVIDDYTLKFYKVENPTEADAFFPITLPKQDLSNLLTKIKDGVKGNLVTIGDDGVVVDSGIKSADIALKSEVKAVNDNLGTLDNLKTADKTNAVAAINEVKDALDKAEKDHKVALTVEAEPTEGMLKTYTIKQGEGESQVVVGKIDIPKDLVVTEGSIVVNPDGQPEGTYIKLVIANQVAPLYINVKDLIDIYTAKANATQIQLAISETNEISATIVAGSVGTTELTDGAITTVKIADKNVTLTKLADGVQTTLAQVDTNKTDINSLKELVGEGCKGIPEEDIYALFGKTPEV